MALSKNAVRTALGYDRTPPKLSAGQKKNMANIRRLLKADDWATVKSGLALAASLDHAKIKSHVAFGLHCTESGRLTATAESLILKTVKEPLRPNAILEAATMAPWATRLTTLDLTNKCSVSWGDEGTIYQQLDVDRGVVETKRSDWLTERLGSGGTTTAISDYSALERFPALEGLALDAAPSGLASFKKLPKLRALSIRNAEDLKGAALSGMGCVRMLKLNWLPWVDLQSLAQLTTIETLHLQRCNKLESLTGLAELNKLKQLRITACHGLKTLSGLNGLSLLEELEVTEAKSLSSIDDLKGLTGLTDLTITGSQSLDSLAPLGGLPNLSRATLSGHGALKGIQGLQHLPALKRLVLEKCPSVRTLKGTGPFPMLTELSLKESGINTLAGFPDLNHLVSLDLENCDRLTSLAGCPDAPLLTKINLRSANRLNSLKGIEAASALEDLDLVQCRSLKSLEDLRGVPSLKKLTLSQNSIISSLDALNNCTKLESVIVQNCPAIVTLGDLSACRALRVFGLHRCAAVRDVSALAQLAGLTKLGMTALNIRDLTPLRGLPLQRLTMKEWPVKFDLDFLGQLHQLTSLDLSHCRYVPEMIRGPLTEEDLKTVLDVIREAAE